MGGCACGIIEASYENERDASNYSRMARERRADAERMIADAERFEEKAKRLNNGGVECEPCEGRGAFDFMGDGRTEWEPCRDCDGFGITRALTCADHSDIDTTDLREIDEIVFKLSMNQPNPCTVDLPSFNPGIFQHWGLGLHVIMAVEKLRAVRAMLPGYTADTWVARHWAWSQVW